MRPFLALCLATTLAACRAGDTRAPTPTPAPTPAVVEHALHLRPARNLDIHIIPWGQSIRRASGVMDDVENLLADDRRGRTSFTVILELANRPPVPEGGEDPLADPATWEFRLHRPGQTDIHPERVEVHTVDRFPTRAGGYHWRLALAVHFPAAATGTPADPDAHPETVLQIRPATDAKHRRDALGPRLADQGVRARLK